MQVLEIVKQLKSLGVVISEREVKHYLSEYGLKESEVQPKDVRSIADDLIKSSLVPVAPKKQESAIAPKSSQSTPPQSGSTRQAAIDVVNAPNEAIRETLSMAQTIAADRLQQKKEATANKLADQIVATSESELDRAADFLLQALGSGFLLETVKQATEDAGWIEGELVESSK